MNRNLTCIVACVALSISLLSMSLVAAAPLTVSKVYAQNKTDGNMTKTNKTGGGLAGSPKAILGMLSTKNASSSVSKFIGGALNQSASNSSSTK
jgi:DNA-binding transcriptional regulator YhcF (GntR family)